MRYERPNSVGRSYKLLMANSICLGTFKVFGHFFKYFHMKCIEEGDQPERNRPQVAFYRHLRVDGQDLHVEQKGRDI